MTRRSNLVQIRVSDEERDEIDRRAEAAGLDRSAWIRQTATGRPHGTVPVMTPEEVEREKANRERWIKVRASRLYHTGGVLTKARARAQAELEAQREYEPGDKP